jgi:23S rRNA (guanosine2251-2'-O)-methyltransferase
VVDTNFDPSMTEILYGIHPIREALAARGQRFQEIWVSRGGQSRAVSETLTEARELGIKVRSHDRQRLAARAGTSNHQGIIAFLSPYSFAKVESILSAALDERAALILVLDGIQDPQNLGALIRTAYVCGAHGVVVPKDRAAPLTAVVDKASAGALEHLDVARVTNLKRTLEIFKREGIWVVGLTMEGDRQIYELDLCQHTALVIGGEARGIRPLVQRACDMFAAIPQRGRLDSLNAAAAGAMALYEAMRQRLTAVPQK